MNIFYNFDNMYDNKKNIVSNDVKNIDKNRAYVKKKDTTANCTCSKTKSDNPDDNFNLDKNIALFDYSAKASSSYVTRQNCSDINCFEGLANQEVPNNCMDYNDCLQYFNTMPLMNCIDNVPTASFLILDD